jgi:hypothetical protein
MRAWANLLLMMLLSLSLCAVLGETKVPMLSASSAAIPPATRDTTLAPHKLSVTDALDALRLLDRPLPLNMGTQRELLYRSIADRANPESWLSRLSSTVTLVSILQVMLAFSVCWFALDLSRSVLWQLVWFCGRHMHGVFQHKWLLAAFMYTPILVFLVPPSASAPIEYPGKLTWILHTYLWSLLEASTILLGCILVSAVTCFLFLWRWTPYYSHPTLLPKTATPVVAAVRPSASFEKWRVAENAITRYDESSWGTGNSGSGHVEEEEEDTAAAATGPTLRSRRTSECCFPTSDDDDCFCTQEAQEPVVCTAAPCLEECKETTDTETLATTPWCTRTPAEFCTSLSSSSDASVCPVESTCPVTSACCPPAKSTELDPEIARASAFNEMQRLAADLQTPLSCHIEFGANTLDEIKTEMSRLRRIQTVNTFSNAGTAIARRKTELLFLTGHFQLVENVADRTKAAIDVSTVFWMLMAWLHQDHTIGVFAIVGLFAIVQFQMIAFVGGYSFGFADATSKHLCLGLAIALNTALFWHAELGLPASLLVFSAGIHVWATLVGALALLITTYVEWLGESRPNIASAAFRVLLPFLAYFGLIAVGLLFNIAAYRNIGGVFLVLQVLDLQRVLAASHAIQSRVVLLGMFSLVVWGLIYFFQTMSQWCSLLTRNA